MLKKIAVTGGTGFVGSHLIHELLIRYPYTEVISISRNEGAIASLVMAEGTPRLKIVVADVRDAATMNRVLNGVETVFHLAAMKRVDLSEEHCEAATTINVIGTMNVLAAFRGDTFIQMSTDKAVEPCNCYGATKLLAEKLVTEYATRQKPPGRYMIVRSGNILHSTGSVLEMWREQIRQHNEITVTDPKMTRYLTTVDGVVRLFIAMFEGGENARIYVTPQGIPVCIGELAQETIRNYGNKDTRIVIIGNRPGERMHERLRSDWEAEVVFGFESTCRAPVAAGAAR